MDEKNKYTGMDILDLAQMAPERRIRRGTKNFGNAGWL